MMAEDHAVGTELLVVERAARCCSVASLNPPPAPKAYRRAGRHSSDSWWDIHLEPWEA